MTVQPEQTLMFAYDYFPGRSLDMIAQLQQSVTRSILGQEDSDGDPIVSDTSEWNTWLVQYQSDGDVGGEYTLVFTRGGSMGDSITLGSSATFFNDEFNLLEVTTGGGGGGGGTPEEGTPTPEEGTPEEGTPTPEEGTPTPEEGTPTPGEGGGGGGGGGDGGGNSSGG